MPPSFIKPHKRGVHFTFSLSAVFAKNEKANLTKAEQNEMRVLMPRLVEGYRKRSLK